MNKKLGKHLTLAALIFLSGSLFASKVKETPRNEEKSVPATVKRTPEVKPLMDETKSVTFHYHRTDNDYNNYGLWIWGTGENGSFHTFEGDDAYGKFVTVPLSNYKIKTEINVIIRYGDWAKQTSDLKVELEPLTAVEDVYHIYLINMDNDIYTSAEEALAPKVLSARFVNEKLISAETFNKPKSYRVLKEGAEVVTGDLTLNDSETNRYNIDANLPDTFVPDFYVNYEMEVTFVDNAVKSRKVAFSGLYDSELFRETMVYDEFDLGATYSKTSTTFKTWSPFSTEVKLRVYENGTPTDVDSVKGSDEYREFATVKGAKGVWTYKLDEDLHGKYYTYVVTNDTYTERETADPYTKAAGVNGRRGLVGDFSVTNPTGWDEVKLESVPPTAQVTYEVHVADFTGDATWNGSEENRMKFLGMIEEGTTYTKDGVTVKTGFDHLKELGVNAVQILPFYDQDNDEINGGYNWGYNPHLYNVMEGIYSKDPYDGFVRMNEVKQVVQKFAENDIRLIMDVVYNHVSSVANNALNIMVPNYYFRTNIDGGLSNGTGVGNDTMSERAMFEHFMIDSTTFLAREYKLGGYRFDLMGYHTIDAMNAVSKAVREINPDFVIHGEPWKPYGGVQPVTPVNVPGDFAYYDNLPKLEDIAAFSDSARDSIVGRVPFSNGRTQGYVHLPFPDEDGNTKKHVEDALLGKFSEYGSGKRVHDDPRKTVNYVSCHDNFTLYDKVRLGAQLSYAGQEDRIKNMAVQAQSIVLLSQGVPFIHAGSEILRSKQFTASTPEIISLLETDTGDYKAGIEPNTYISNNSYKWPIEINSIKWDLKIENYNVFEIYKQLIDLKQNDEGFNYTTREDIDEHVKVTWGSDLEGEARTTDAVIRYEVNDYLIYFVGATTSVKLDVDGYEVVLDTYGHFNNGERLKGIYNVRGYGSFTLVLKKAGKSSAKLSAGAIAGIAVGATILVGTPLFFGIYFLIKKKPKKA